MVHKKTNKQSVFQRAADRKLFTTLFVVFFVLLVAYIVTFTVRKPVYFSTNARTCVDQLTLLPDLHKVVHSSAFSVSFKDEMTIGLLPLFSKKVCFKPTIVPNKGEYEVATSPFGGYVAQKIFIVIVSD